MQRSLVGSMLVGVLMIAAGTSVSLAQATAEAVKVKAASSASAGIDLSAKLPTDPRLVKGELANGMKYIVMQHSNPPSRANMWIHISSGSLNETDKQRGIAHYLEHMAFNGSENFPPGTTIDFFQSMGLNFGQHQNAFTSFDQTTYQLTMPDTKPETIDKGMLFFADVAGRLLIKPEEIESERQIIMEEKTARSSAQQRISEVTLPKMFPGSRIGDRLPIGVKETILGVQRQDFLDYLNKWYQPSNMTVIVVADMPAADVIKHIEKNFGAVGKKTPVPVDESVGVKPYTDDGAIVAQDEELTEADLAMIRVDAARPPTTTIADMRRDAIEQIGFSAFGRRIADKLSAGGTSYTSASAFGFNMFNAAFAKQANASGEPGKWREMLAELGADVQRARIHGFTQRELDLVKKEIISGAELSVEREKTLPARALIGRINNDIASGEPTMGAQQTLDLYRAVLPTITIEEVNSTFATLFEPKNVRFMLTLPKSESAPSEAELLDLGRKAFSVTPEKTAEVARASSMMDALPKAGTITSTNTHDATGITTAMLANGVRVHHRFMDIRKDTVSVSITLAGGAIQENAQTKGTAEAASLAWGRQATGKLGSTDIRELMTGKKVNVGGGAGLDTMTLSVSGSPAELETGMQLAHLLLTDPKIEQAAFDQWKVESKQQIEARKMNPQGVFAEQAAKLIFPETEVRTRPMEIADVDRVQLADAQAWLTKTVNSAPIEVAIVGDISKDRAMELAAQYLGSLPKREAMGASTLDDLRNIKPTQGPRELVKSVETKTPASMVVTGFYAADASNLTDTRTLQAAAQIMRTRGVQILREKLQLVYSAQVASQPGREFPGFGTFIILAPTQPGKEENLRAESWKLLDEFAANGPTEEEMTTMRKQMANLMDEQMKQPDFWMARTSQLAYRDQKVEDIMGLPEFFQTVTAQQIKDVFNKYYLPEHKMSLIVSPATAAAPTGG